MLKSQSCCFRSARGETAFTIAFYWRLVRLQGLFSSAESVKVSKVPVRNRKPPNGHIAGVWAYETLCSWGVLRNSETLSGEGP